jgi:hypothetical protein
MTRAGKLLEKLQVADGSLERVQPRNIKRAIYNLAKMQWRKNNYDLKPVPQAGHQPSSSGAEA